MRLLPNTNRDNRSLVYECRGENSYCPARQRCPLKLQSRLCDESAYGVRALHWYALSTAGHSEFRLNRMPSAYLWRIHLCRAEDSQARIDNSAASYEYGAVGERRCCEKEAPLYQCQ